MLHAANLRASWVVHGLQHLLCRKRSRVEQPGLLVDRTRPVPFWRGSPPVLGWLSIGGTVTCLRESPVLR